MQSLATPLFMKTHDFNVWLINHTQRFPKSLRQSYTLRLESAAIDFEQAILMANSLRDHERHLWLLQADGRLVLLRSLIRYALDWHLLGGKQIQYAAEAIDELGRLLGAWLKGIDRIAPAGSITGGKVLAKNMRIARRPSTNQICAIHRVSL